MKFLLVIALFAGVRADAEADPQLLVHHSPLVYGVHHALPHVPVVKSVEVKPAEVKTTPLVTYAYPYLHAYNGLWGHGLPLTVPLTGAPAAAAEAEAPAVEAAERRKREADADADAEADPYYLTYGLHHPYYYTTPLVKPVVKKVEVKAPALTYTYPTTYGYPYHFGYHGLHPYSYWNPYVVTKPVEAEAEAEAVEAERKKRDAEADPEADPYYLTYGLHHPYVYTAPVVKPAVKTVEAKAPALTYAYHHALPYTYGYHGVYPYSYGYGLPYVFTKPVEAEAEAEAVEAERKKRDADAEADPAILASSTRVLTPATPVTYSPYAHLPLTYNVPYARHGVYAGYPFAHTYAAYGWGK